MFEKLRWTGDPSREYPASRPMTAGDTLQSPREPMTEVLIKYNQNRFKNSFKKIKKGFYISRFLKATTPIYKIRTQEKLGRSNAPY